MSLTVNYNYYIERINYFNNNNLDGELLVNGIDYMDIMSMIEFTDNGMQEYEESLAKHLLVVKHNSGIVLKFQVPPNLCTIFIYVLVHKLRYNQFDDILGKDSLYIQDNVLVLHDGVYKHVIGDTTVVNEINEVTKQEYTYRMVYLAFDGSLNIRAYKKVSTNIANMYYEKDYKLDAKTLRELVDISNAQILHYFLDNDLEYKNIITKD